MRCSRSRGGEGQQVVRTALSLFQGYVSPELVVVEPFETTLESGQAVECFSRKGHRRDQGKQSDEGTGIQSAGFAIFRTDLIIVKAVFLIPQTGPAEMIDGLHDLHEVFEEFGGHILVGGIDGVVWLTGEDDGNLEHVQAVESHPGGRVGLLQFSPDHLRNAAVKDPDVVEAEQSVLAPAIGATSGMFMGEVAPRVSIGGVVLPNGGIPAMRHPQAGSW